MNINNRKEEVRVLVTGGAGFVGSHTVNELLNNGYHVNVLDNLSTGLRSNLPNSNSSFRFIEGDILDPSARKDSIEGCDAIIHLAAISSVPACATSPELSRDVNVNATLALYNDANINMVKKFIFAGSASIYGNIDINAISEGYPKNPISSYGVDKLSAEHYLRVLSRNLFTSLTSFRFFNIYGPGQVVDSSYSGVISVFIDKFMNAKEMTIYGDGKQTRDFIYIHDVAKLLVSTVSNKNDYTGIYNVGTGIGTSLSELISIIQSNKYGIAKVAYEVARVGDIHQSVADVSSLKRLIKSFAPTSIKDGITLLINHLHKERKEKEL